MKFFIYVLRSQKDNSFYIGQTNNIGDRLARHNSGRSLSTKSKRPWELIYQKDFTTRSEAVLFERKLKSFKNRDYLLRYISA
jgi:putative endonuclease